MDYLLKYEPMIHNVPAGIQQSSHAPPKTNYDTFKLEFNKPYKISFSTQKCCFLLVWQHSFFETNPVKSHQIKEYNKS